MDPKDLTKLTKQEHFILDVGIYLIFQNADQLDQLSKIKLDSVNQEINWQLTNGNYVNYQITYNHNHRLETMLNTFLASSLDQQKHFQPKIEKYVYLTNLSFPLGNSYQNPEHFSKQSTGIVQSKVMNDDQKTTVKKNFVHSPIQKSSQDFKKFWKYFWKRFAIQQPNFNEDDDISRNNELVSCLIKTLSNNSNYQVGNRDIISLVQVLNPLRQILNCNLWANNFDYQHHVYVPGSKIQAFLQPKLNQLTKNK